MKCIWLPHLTLTSTIVYCFLYLDIINHIISCYISLSLNSCYFIKNCESICFYNGYGLCSLWGGNWTFKYSFCSCNLQELNRCWSQWASGLRRRPVAARLMGLQVRIRQWACLSVVSVVCCACRGLCIGLITRPEESYWAWCVWVQSVQW